MKHALKICLIVLLLKFYVNTQDDNQTCVTCGQRKVRSEFFDSINGLKDKVISYFNRSLQSMKPTFKGINARRLKIKKAFLRFLDEAFTNKTYNCVPATISMNYDEPKRSTPELITMHGYRSETHTILSSDGYMLTIHRVLAQFTNTRIERKVVILQHGLLGSSMDWILLGPKRALPYLLLDAGFDVWLPNARGNKYSKYHENIPVDSVKFWDYSWHEIGLYDTPAIIDYVKKNVISNSKISFIAYSMSATALLVLLSSLPEYNAILTSVVLLAPLIYLKDVEGPLKYIAEKYDQKHVANLRHLKFNNFSAEEILEENVVKRFCRGPRFICENPLLLLGDGGKPKNDFNMTASILNNVPSGGSKKTIVHYLQVISSGVFQMFDFGVADNIKKYGQTFPPIYKLNNIDKSLILFNSVGDWLSTTLDINSFIEQLSVEVAHHLITSNDFSHLDFMWSYSAPELVYLPLINELNKTLS